MMITNLTIDYLKGSGDRTSIRVSRSDGQSLRVKLSENIISKDKVVEIGNISIFDRDLLKVDTVSTQEKKDENGVYTITYMDLETVGLGAGALHVLILEKDLFVKTYEILCPYKLAKGISQKIGESKYYYDPAKSMFFITTYFNSSKKNTASFTLKIELSNKVVSNLSNESVIDLSKIASRSDNELFIDLYGNENSFLKFLRGIWDKSFIRPAIPIANVGIELKKPK